MYPNKAFLSVLKTNFNKTSSKDLTLQEVKELDENFDNYLGQIMITETE